MDTVDGQVEWDHGKLYRIQFVGKNTAGQVLKIFLQYVDSHPEREEEGAPHVLARSLGEKGLTGAFDVPFSECHQQ